MRFRVTNGFLEITAETAEEGVQLGAAWQRLCDTGVDASIGNGKTMHVPVSVKGNGKGGKLEAKT